MAKDDFIEEPVEGSGGGDMLGTGLVIITTLVLIVAFILVEMSLATYGRGLLAN
jgi:hypothetical protein